MSLRIFDPQGRQVRTLIEERVFKGDGQAIDVLWNGLDDGGRPVGSGLFLYQVQTPVAARAASWSS